MNHKLQHEATDFSRSNSIRICTLFDSKFLAQGLALINSVEEKLEVDVVWDILALDTASFLFLESLKKANFNSIFIEDFPDSDLLNLKFKREWKEFCWTSAACLLNYSLGQSPNGSMVSYIDADCYFFDDLTKLLNPLNRGFSIVVHEHKFSEDRREWLERSGRFNVGLVAGLKGSEFDKCVARWRNQVLERCDVSHSEGRCGDQTYLNEWPTLYPSMHILEEPGAGLGPWNIKNHEVTKQNGKILIDGQPFYFFHFSSMEFLFFSKLVVIYICAAGYLRMRKNERFIYKSYVKKLIDIYKYYGFRPMVKRDTKTLFASLIFRRTSFTVSKI